MLESRFPQIIAELPLTVGAAIREGTEAIAADAKERAPDPPPVGQYLAESIEARSGVFKAGRRSRFANVAEDVGFARPTGKFASTYEAYGIYSAWYWYFVEFGTSHSTPRPFMMPAVEAGALSLIAGVSAALKAL